MLPAPNRARLVRDLISSLDGAADFDPGEAWLAEIERRTRALNDGTAVLVDWACVRERWCRRWAAR